MNIAQIEENLQKLVANLHQDTLIYDLLLAYGQPKASIARLQKGGLNLSAIPGEILWKKNLFFKTADPGEDLQDLLDRCKTYDKAIRHNPRFLLVTDFETLLAFDRKTLDSLDIPIQDLARHFDFFLPWAGMEKAQHQHENPADVKAAERMAKLFDEIKKSNPTRSPKDLHDLNVFLSRLLFCFFAEDTGIFITHQFTGAVSSHTQEDGSDLAAYLDQLFEVLNTEPARRKNLPAYLEAFPFVNGGLFKNPHPAPVFDRKSRSALIECGGLHWRDINPDIFGSMIQAVVSPEHRGGLGMHYTSVPNIMKVIQPLFLDELYEAFEAAKGNLKKLKELLRHLWLIKVFDPACGSGNFLIIAYKELRRLEMSIFKEVNRINQTHSPQFSEISLDRFYGIELDDFAHEIAMLSLWLAEHQMNQEFFKEFGRSLPALPLKSTGNIVQGNACRLDWEEVCPKEMDGEVFVLGNPPYLGARVLDDKQKADMKFVFHGKVDGYNDLDYVACWFFKGANFIRKHNAKCAFVATNSICQGSQVANLWPHILKDEIEIDFARQSFKWTNMAKAKAAVIVIVLGIRNVSGKPKFIINDTLKITVKNISPYLIEADTVYVFGRRNLLSKLPAMNFGSMPNDGGHLLLTEDEYKSVLATNPGAKRFLKKFTGSKEFINDIPRWCIWIEDSELSEAEQFEFIKDRMEKVKQHRLSSDREATNGLANSSHSFAEIRFKKTNSVIVPSVSSERREYVPIGFLDESTIISNLANAIYDAAPWAFSMVTSRMHMTWLKAVGGRLKMDYRYSTALVYNTFPFPSITPAQKQDLETHVYRILEEREAHSEKTLAQLYDPDKMPPGLREAHRQNDLAVERCYRSKPFGSDEERLEYLFKLYEQMIAEEQVKGTLFEGKKEKKKGKK